MFITLIGRSFVLLLRTGRVQHAQAESANRNTSIATSEQLNTTSTMPTQPLHLNPTYTIRSSHAFELPRTERNTSPGCWSRRKYNTSYSSLFTCRLTYCRRAAKKRLLGDASFLGSDTMPSRPAKKLKTIEKDTGAKKKAVGFLDLPAGLFVSTYTPCTLLTDVATEVRNTIYVHADSHHVHGELLLARWGDGRRPYPGKEHCTSRAYLGLTQTCQTIRTEHRPMWLRSCTTQANCEDLTDFLDVFYSSSADYQNVPEQLQICVDRHNVRASLSSMTVMTRLCDLRAHRLSAQIQFVGGGFLSFWSGVFLLQLRCMRSCRRQPLIAKQLPGIGQQTMAYRHRARQHLLGWLRS